MSRFSMTVRAVAFFCLPVRCGTSAQGTSDFLQWFVLMAVSRLQAWDLLASSATDSSRRRATWDRRQRAFGRSKVLRSWLCDGSKAKHSNSSSVDSCKLCLIHGLAVDAAKSWPHGPAMCWSSKSSDHRSPRRTKSDETSSVVHLSPSRGGHWTFVFLNVHAEKTQL